MIFLNGMWETLIANAGSVLLWLPQNGVEVGWCVSFGPPILCLLGVHLFFRNIFSVLFFTMKVVIAFMVYVHIKTLVSSAAVSYSFESILFGVPSGTLHAPLTVGFQILYAKMFSRVISMCPVCFPSPTPPIPPPPVPSQSPWVDWIGDHNGL